MSSKNNLIVFCYSAKTQNFPFFKELGFTDQASHKSLEFLYVSDQPDEHFKTIPADIVFVEESATITDNLYNTITKAGNLYVIYTCESEAPLEKLFFIRKGNIHRKVIKNGIEQEVAIELISQMALAYSKRKKKLYLEQFELLLSLFKYNYLQEAQLQIMHASNNKQLIAKILSENEATTDIFTLVTKKLLEHENIKSILSRLASEELSNPEALLKIRAQLRQEIFADLDVVT